MILARRKDEVRAQVGALRKSGERLALVPTMGFLHEGHLSLIRRGRELADRVAVSIFVNPAQFGAGEDLDRYPRDLEGDLEKCRQEGVWMVYAPSDPSEVYPPGYGTWVDVESPLAQGLCGESRPGHFRGVATVVLKLFHLFEPEVAVFGKKDYQQLAVVRKMAEDLDMRLRIEGGETVREPDGLALSSRNAYLSAEERIRATSLFRGLSRAGERFAAGERQATALLEAAREIIAPSVDRIDYLELVDARSLTPVEEVREKACLLVAAFVGKTRLIDNLELG